MQAAWPSGSRGAHEESDEEWEAAADAVDEVNHLQRRSLPPHERFKAERKRRSAVGCSRGRRGARKTGFGGPRRASVYTALQERSTKRVTIGIATASLTLAPLSPVWMREERTLRAGPRQRARRGRRGRRARRVRRGGAPSISGMNCCGMHPIPTSGTAAIRMLISNARRTCSSGGRAGAGRRHGCFHIASRRRGARQARGGRRTLFSGEQMSATTDPSFRSRSGVFPSASSSCVRSHARASSCGRKGGDGGHGGRVGARPGSGRRGANWAAGGAGCGARHLEVRGDAVAPAGLELARRVDAVEDLLRVDVPPLLKEPARAAVGGERVKHEHHV